MNLYSLFLKNLSKKKKIIFNKEVLTYSEFRDGINSICKSKIFFKSKRIALISGDQKFIAMMLFACSKNNATLISINNDLALNQIVQQLKLTKPDLIIYEGDNKFSKINSRQKKISKNLFLKDDKTEKIKEINSDMNKKFIVTFSSGTTSAPKAVVYSQKTKYLRYLQMKNIYRVKKNDTIFSASPMDHSLGQRLLFLALLNGSNFVYSSKYNFSEIKENIRKYKISFAVLPSNFLMLLKKKFLKKEIFIKKIVSAASTLTTLDKKSIIKSGIKLHEMYGASEVGTVTSIDFSKNYNEINSVGKVLKNIKLQILDENNKSLPKGIIGEIACKTPLQFQGYYRNKTLTKKSFFKDYFKTGDLGKIDKNNFLYFVSRKHDVIISGGKNIYPIDIEKELTKLQFIKEAAVIGIKDKFFGEVVFAVCVTKNKISNAESKIKEFLSKKLSKHQLPLGYAFEKCLLKNKLGKIRKNEIRLKYNSLKIDLTKNLRKILN